MFTCSFSFLSPQYIALLHVSPCHTTPLTCCFCCCFSLWFLCCGCYQGMLGFTVSQGVGVSRNDLKIDPWSHHDKVSLGKILNTKLLSVCVWKAAFPNEQVAPYMVDLVNNVYLPIPRYLQWDSHRDLHLRISRWQKPGLFGLCWPLHWPCNSPSSGFQDSSRDCSCCSLPENCWKSV